MLFPIALALAAQAAEPPKTGLTAAARTIVKSDPSTYDLAGFRLGMSEADVEAILKTRGLKVARAQRVADFGTQVANLANQRGASVRQASRSVLGSADIDDGQGGRVVLKLLTWPDAARVSSITYLPPRGTQADRWKSMLVEKYGPAADGGGRVDAEGFHASWCGQASCLGGVGVFLLSAEVGNAGGSVHLRQPDGSSRRVKALIEAAADTRAPRHSPSL
ncbi:hypothetical protein [uncultured Sphingobium sp.]|jgi:hypothetical protein|uniref:hypothetical protein n=1 Tax=uncultured Sphingobium sp. TaxID=316087 RepID=UPI0032B21034|tara:strand:+ start:23217 stop:23876 length:660 start_codon:yes stop_codon:yes gene_type:complete